MTLRDVVIFLAGAQALHTLSHLLVPVFFALPVQLKWPRMSLTAGLNTFAVVFNAVTAALLLVWAGRL